jgi:hypothetical protein
MFSMREGAAQVAPQGAAAESDFVHFWLLSLGMSNLQGSNTTQAAIQTQESARDARQALTHFAYFTVLVRESEKADQGAKSA